MKIRSQYLIESCVQIILAYLGRKRLEKFNVMSNLIEYQVEADFLKKDQDWL